jgi:hypothetical protein
MAYAKAKLKFKNKEFTFDTWVGRPQYPVQHVETVTRLGGSTLIIQPTYVEGKPTNFTATILSQTADDKAAINELEVIVTDLTRNYIGKQAKWIDENGIVVGPVYLMDDITYSIKLTDGAAKAICTISGSTVMDESQEN